MADRRGVVTGHELVWKNPNPNREVSLEEMKKKEKLSKGTNHGRKAIGAWEQDNEEIVVPESYIVSDSSVNEKNREFVKLQNDIRETRNVYIQTALAKKAQDRNKLLGMHTKNFKNLRAKIPAIMEAIADLNGIAVPYPLHLKNLPDLNTLPAGNKSAY